VDRPVHKLYREVTYMAIVVDVDITQGFFEDVYGRAGIPPGSEIILKNKSTSKSILVVVALTPPAADSTDGYEVEPREVAVVPSNNENVWARATTGTMWLNVQEAPGVKPDTGTGASVIQGSFATNSVTRDTQALLLKLDEIADKLAHLNLMFDEAFETSLTQDDITRT